ncbi:unnamed protein product, partial [Amoebophrya sp. A120]
EPFDYQVRSIYIVVSTRRNKPVLAHPASKGKHECRTRALAGRPSGGSTKNFCRIKLQRFTDAVSIF